MVANKVQKKNKLIYEEGQDEDKRQKSQLSLMDLQETIYKTSSKDFKTTRRKNN